MTLTLFTKISTNEFFNIHMLILFEILKNKYIELIILYYIL